MTSAPARQLYSPEDLLTMEDGDWYELEDGVLEEKPVGAESEDVADNLRSQIRRFLEQQPLGHVIGANVGLQIFPDRPRRLPRPDGGFIARGKLVDERMPPGHLRQVPDL